MAAYWRTTLTLRQLAPLFGVSKSAADRIVDRLGPCPAFQPRRRFHKGTVLIVDGTLCSHARPHRGRAVEELPVVHEPPGCHRRRHPARRRGRPLPGNRNDCKAWELSGAKRVVGRTTVIADGGYRGTGVIIPHRRERGQTELPAWKEEHNTSHRRVRARVEHTFASMKTWKILRDCHLKGDGVHQAVLGIARLHNLTVAR